ncbi:MAG: hypothetical protein EAS52_03805 [Parapedobacter sp.]|nr:MAG: hypothetical protein EAS52_03805 [Parapedobacter sp.]
MQKHLFKAGAAQIDITPPLGTVINGEFRTRYANKIADPLYAKALVLEGESSRLVIVLVDTCAMQRALIDETKALITAELGILPEHQLIASTHTHSAGAVEDLLMGHVDLAYRQKMPGLIARAAKKAADNSRTAKIAWGVTDQPQHVLCRRYQMTADCTPRNPVTGAVDAVMTNPFGNESKIIGPTTEPDPGLGYLAVKGLDDEWIAMLANYSLHYVGDCERGTISADYFGYFARALASKLSAKSEFVGMMSNGTSGEINLWDFQHPGQYPTEPHQKSALVADDLASAVVRSMDGLAWEEAPRIDAVFNDVSVGVRKPSEGELRHAKDVVQATDYEAIAFGQPDFFEQVYAREQVFLSRYPDQKLFPVQSLRIGSGAIGALGGEFFSETGKKLKGIAPAGKYFTICMANDYVGYVPPAHELEKGGYETWRCRTSYLDAAAEETIRTSLARQLNKYG